MPESDRREGPPTIEARLSWGLSALGIVFVAVGGTWGALAGTAGTGAWYDYLALFLTSASFSVVGALVVGRFPRNVLGWILVTEGLLAGSGLLAITYAHQGLVRHPGSLPGAEVAAWVEGWFWYPTLALIIPFLLLFFPTGTLPSRAWRPVLWVSSVVLAVTTIGPMLQARLKSGYDIANPIGIAAIEDAEALLAPAFLVAAACALAAVVSLVIRFRRSSGVERMQLKWFTFAAGSFFVSAMLGDLLSVPDWLFSLTIVGLPLSIGVAILRYRLYEIDVIINRALVYAVVTGFLVLSYLGLVFALQLLLDPVTQDSDVAVAASTLAVAALFRPVRARIQGFIDQRFYRRKYDSTQALSQFGARLRDEVDLGVVENDVLGVLHETVQPAHASLWLRSGGMAS